MQYRLFLSLVLGGLVSCAAGNDGSGGAGAQGGEVPWTTGSGAGGSGAGAGASGGSGAGGSGGASNGGGGAAAGGTGATGGSGGVGASGGGGEGAGGAGGAGGGASTSMLAAVGLRAAGVTLARFDGDAETWAVEEFPASPSGSPAIALRSIDDGLVLFRNGGALSFAPLDNGGFAAPLPVGAAITTRWSPAVSSNGIELHSLFHGDDFKHYAGVYQSSWGPAAEPVGAAQSFGPEPGTIVSQADGSALIAFVGGDGDLYTQTRTAAGVWQAAEPHGVAPTAVLTPVLTRLSSGTLVLVFNRQNTTASYQTFSGGIWSAVANLPDTFTSQTMSLTTLPLNQAALAFRGTNGLGYVSLFSPATGFAQPVPTGLGPTPSCPAVAAGVGGHAIELAYVDGTTSQLSHARAGFDLVFGSVTSMGSTGVLTVAAASAD